MSKNTVLWPIACLSFQQVDVNTICYHKKAVKHVLLSIFLIYEINTSINMYSVHVSTITCNYNCSAGFKLILDVLQMCSGSVGEPAVSTLWFSTQTAGSRPSASYNSWSCPPRGMTTWPHCWDSCTPPPSGLYNSKLTYSRSGSLSNFWQNSLNVRLII